MYFMAKMCGHTTHKQMTRHVACTVCQDDTHATLWITKELERGRLMFVCVWSGIGARFMPGSAEGDMP